MKVVAYCRVSTDSDDQLNSLDAQVTYYTELFKTKEYEIAECGLLNRRDKTKEALAGIYADEGISGTSLKNRDAFKQMLSDAKKHLFDRIYVKDTTRWARDVENGTRTLKDLKESGVGVTFEQGGLDSLNPTHELVINMLLSTSQEESRFKSHSVQFGIRQAMKKGKWNSNPPFGYNLVDGYLEINPDEAEIVELIFNLYLNKGWGTQRIARELNDREIPTKMDVMWSQKQIMSIIRHPIYIGRQIQGKTRNIDVNRNIKEDIPEEDWIKHYFEHLQIIDDEVFEEAQKVIKKRSKMFQSNRRPSSVHLFSNLLVCGNCGTGLRRKKRRAYVRKDGTSKDLGYEWACTMNDRYGNARCEYRNALAEDFLVPMIQKEIINHQQNKYMLDNMFERYLETYYNPNTEEEISKLKKEIDKLQRTIKMNLDLLVDEIITKEQYQEQNDELQQELKAKESRLNRLIYIDREVDEAKRKYNSYKQYLDNIDINNLTNVILKNIIKEIKVLTFDDPVTAEQKKDWSIEWNFMEITSSDLFADFQKQLLRK